MSMTVSSIKTHFRRWREWELNPVVVKELRQAVRSWAMSGMLLLFLAVMFLTALAFLVNQSFREGADRQLGVQVFQSFMVILTASSLTFIPLYVGIRLAIERQESNLDLLYVTTLTSGRIVRGKFLCGAYMAVIFFSACMPFMVFTNLLRGIDLPTIGFILICLFLVVCAAVQAAIFLACLPLSKWFKLLVALIALIGVFVTIGPLVMLFLQLLRMGVGSMMFSGRVFWPGFFSAVGVILAGVVLLYFLSNALLAPVSANRALPLRICVTVLWLLGAGLSALWMHGEREARLVLPWAMASFVLLVGSLVVIVSGLDRLSLRVRRAIPSRSTLRALAFVFYNGAAGGLVWVTLLLAATFAVTCAVLDRASGWPGFSTMSHKDVADFATTAGAVLVYALDYGLLALLLHRRFLARRPPRLAGVLAILLPGAWALIPYIVAFFLNHLTWRLLESFQPGNVFNIFMLKDDNAKALHLMVALGWLFVMLMLNARWFARQVKEFQPLERAVEPPRLSETPTPISTSVN